SAPRAGRSLRGHSVVGGAPFGSGPVSPHGAGGAARIRQRPSDAPPPAVARHRVGRFRLDGRTRDDAGLRRRDRRSVGGGGGAGTRGLSVRRARLPGAPGDHRRLLPQGGHLVAGGHHSAPSRIMITPEHVRVNRDHWNEQADEWVAPGERRWASVEPVWGIWGIPESELGMLPPDLEGRDAIELGCGTGYVSAWMARRGARVVGVDISERQLATAQRLAAEHEVDIEWVHADAEDVPKPADSFDFAISEYGAALWCDPHAWIPEAHRLLRP